MFFNQVRNPADQSTLGSGQIKAIKALANNDPNWTSPSGMRGPRTKASPLQEQRQNVRVAEISDDLALFGHDIRYGGRYLDTSGKPVKLGAENVMPGIGRRPDITAYGPVGPQGPVPFGTQGPNIRTMEYHINVGPNRSARSGGGPTIEEQRALDAMRNAGYAVFYYGYGQRNR